MPCYFFFNLLLWVILALNVYWFGVSAVARKNVYWFGVSAVSRSFTGSGECCLENVYWFRVSAVAHKNVYMYIVRAYN